MDIIRPIERFEKNKISFLQNWQWETKFLPRIKEILAPRRERYAFQFRRKFNCIISLVDLLNVTTYCWFFFSFAMYYYLHAMQETSISRSKWSDIELMTCKQLKKNAINRWYNRAWTFLKFTGLSRNFPYIRFPWTV